MKKAIFSAAFVLTGLVLFAQPGGGTPGGAPAPIDGGISLLIAAGAALGGKKAYDAYKNKSQD